MPWPEPRRCTARLAAGFVAGLVFGPVVAAGLPAPEARPAPVAAAALPEDEAVRAAANAVYEDPLLNALKAERELRFKRDEGPRPEDDRLKWLADFADWLGEAGRWLVWLLGAALLALLLLRLRQLLRIGLGKPQGKAWALPSHVQDLDIRPESLPEDLAQAVRALWQRGQVRQALSLLYRGALSRLVHEEGVPIRAASTEGECLALARARLGDESHGYLAQLVGLWQRTVYGAQEPDAALLLALCEAFDSRLPRRPRTATALGPSSASAAHAPAAPTP